MAHFDETQNELDSHWVAEILAHFRVIYTVGNDPNVLELSK